MPLILLTCRVLQDHTALYRSRPPLPEGEGAWHTLPTARKMVKEAEREARLRAEEEAAAAAGSSSSSTEDNIPLAEVMARGKEGRTSSPTPAEELVEALPLVPKNRRVVRKRKEITATSSR